MAAHTLEICVRTHGKGTYEVTGDVNLAVAESGITHGTVTVFVQHTSASTVLMENADPTARSDLHAFFDRLVPEDLDYFEHTYEGPDDMPSHIRMALTRSSEVIPVINGRATLGTWQGIYLFEHRDAPHTRRVSIAVVGD